MMMPYSFVRSASRIAVRSTIAFIPNISICLTVLVLILILVLIPLTCKGILDSCIQLLCCIVSHLWLSVIDSCRFANNCQVSAGQIGIAIARRMGAGMKIVVGDK